MKSLFSVAFLAAIASLAFSLAPASAQQYQGNGVLPSTLCSAVTAGYPTQCAPTVGDKPFYSAVTTTLTQFIAAPASPSAIRFTFLQFLAVDSAGGGDFLLEQGTGTNCGTNTAVVAKLGTIPATGSVTGSFGWAEGTIFQLKPGYAACVAGTGTITSAAVAGMYVVF